MGLATINGLHELQKELCRLWMKKSRCKLHPVLNLMQSIATATAVGAWLRLR
jgi:hypothetical protein